MDPRACKKSSRFGDAVEEKESIHTEKLLVVALRRSIDDAGATARTNPVSQMKLQ
jgi:hypothetical protein